MKTQKKAKTVTNTSLFFIFFVVGFLILGIVLFSLIDGGFSSDLFVLLFPGFFLFIGAWGVFKWFKEWRKKTALKKFGIVKNVKISEIKRKGGIISVNHVNYYGYVFICNEGKDVYESSVVYVDDIDNYARVGDLIPVYVSQDIPVRYWCDVDNIIQTVQGDETITQKYGDSRDDVVLFKELIGEDLFAETNQLSSNKKIFSYFEYLPSIIFVIMGFVPIMIILPILTSIDFNRIFDEGYLYDILYKHPEFFVLFVMICCFVGFGSYSLIKIRKKHKLIESGNKIKARIVDIKKKYGKNTSYVIYAMDGNNTYKSDNVFFSPYSIGDEIFVYIDEFDPKKYWVDTSSSSLSSFLLNSMNVLSGKIKNDENLKNSMVK